MFPCVSFQPASQIAVFALKLWTFSLWKKSPVCEGVYGAMTNSGSHVRNFSEWKRVPRDVSLRDFVWAVPTTWQLSHFKYFMMNRCKHSNLSGICDLLRVTAVKIIGSVREIETDGNRIDCRWKFSNLRFYEITSTEIC